MGATTRFGVSMDRELAGMLDRLTDSAGYPNRSEAIRSLVRQELIRTGGEEDDREVAGVITLIYRYGMRLAPAPIADDSSIHVSANLQLHLEKDVCMKLIVVRGACRDVHEWAKKLTGQRGVIGRFTVCATDDILREIDQ